MMDKYPLPEENEKITWSDWRLEFEGSFYRPKFPTMDAWFDHYNPGARQRISDQRREALRDMVDMDMDIEDGWSHGLFDGRDY
jgi:hypothetical protein